MNIDTGLAIVIVAVLVFYLRLIIIQRERAKRLARSIPTGGKTKGKAKEPPGVPPERYSILSHSRRDRLIGGAGALFILAGLLLNMKLLPFPAAQPFLWIPTAIGIVAFSWAFKL